MTDALLIPVSPNHATALLRERGWTRVSGRHAWISPHGVVYWQTDEALSVALRVEACSVPWPEAEKVR